MPFPINFLNPDSEAAQAALAQAIQSIPVGVPIMGLVLKVARSLEGEETLVNYEFADPDWLRSLALIFRVNESEEIDPFKES